MRVMLIEDSDIVLRVLHHLLKQVRGATIIGEFDTAAGAIRALPQDTPDTILLNIQLRSGTGMEVLKVVSANYPNIKVFVVTNFTDEVYRKRYLEEGAFGFFDKSRDLAALRTGLQTLSGYSRLT